MKTEHEELLDSYQEMSTEELLDHWESGTLTALATQLAREELIRRDVALPPITPIDEDSIADSSEAIVFETIARSITATDMHILHGRLEADGIPSYVVDDNVNLAGATGGVRLQVEGKYAKDAKRVIAEVSAGDLTLEENTADAPALPSAPDNAIEKTSLNWESLVTTAIFIFAGFEFLKTVWFARTFNSDIEWDLVSSLALGLPILFFVSALLLVFHSKWAMPGFIAHLILSIGPIFILTSPDQPIPVEQITGWFCTAAIIYFCMHLRRQRRVD